MSPLGAMRRLLRSPSEEYFRAIRLQEKYKIVRVDRGPDTYGPHGDSSPTTASAPGSPSSPISHQVSPLPPREAYNAPERISEASLRKLEAASAFAMHMRVLKDVRTRFAELMSRTQKLSRRLAGVGVFEGTTDPSHWGHFERIYAALADIEEHLDAYDLYLCRVCSGIDPAELEEVVDPFDLDLVTHRMLRYVLLIDEHLLLLEVFPRDKELLAQRIGGALKGMGECTSVFK